MFAPFLRLAISTVILEPGRSKMFYLQLARQVPVLSDNKRVYLENHVP